MHPSQLPFGPDWLHRAGRPELRLRWLGTAGFELSCDGYHLLIDPYLSRVSLGRCLGGPLAPDRQVIGEHVAHADAIVLGHTHFDHALDVPALAQQTGATVVGSRSAMALCRSAGILQRQLREIEPGSGQPEHTTLGPFELELAHSLHSPLVAGRIPFPGEIGNADGLPLPVHRYRPGTVLRIGLRVGGRTLVHVGSGALGDEPPARAPTDLALLCASGWRASERFPERVAVQLAPRTVLLMHWDDFFRPLARPARPLPGLRLGELLGRLRGQSPEIAVGTLPPLGELRW